MRYLKTFENFSDVTDWKSVIETNPHFDAIEDLVNNNVEASELFDDLVYELSEVDKKMVEPLFYNFESSSELLREEFKEYKKTYKMGSITSESMIQNVDPSGMAKQALKYILGLGIMGGLVKLVYIVGEYVFQKLDELGIYSVAGGVLLILIYLAIFGGKKKSSKEVVKSDSDYTDFEEL